MKSHRVYLTFKVSQRMDFRNITSEVEAVVRESGVREGLVLVNAMHITASVFINDSATPPRPGGVPECSHTILVVADVTGDTTDEMGAFEVTGLGPGPYSMVIRWGGKGGDWISSARGSVNRASPTAPTPPSSTDVSTCRSDDRARTPELV